jgi:hypothetical protein
MHVNCLMESLDVYRTSLHKKKIQQYYQPNGADQLPTRNLLTCPTVHQLAHKDI